MDTRGSQKTMCVMIYIVTQTMHVHVSNTILPKEKEMWSATITSNNWDHRIKQMVLNSLGRDEIVEDNAEEVPQDVRPILLLMKRHQPWYLDQQGAPDELIGAVADLDGILLWLHCHYDDKRHSLVTVMIDPCSHFSPGQKFLAYTVSPTLNVRFLTLASWLAFCCHFLALYSVRKIRSSKI